MSSPETSTRDGISENGEQGDWMLMPYLATDANEDIMVQPSSSEKMTIEYAVFHQ